MICLVPMCPFRIRINPDFADHPYIKHKVQSTTQCITVCAPPSQHNLTSAVPDKIPSEGWPTFDEFFIKSVLIGIIYFCLIVIYKYSRDFLYWIDSPGRQVQKSYPSRRCANKLIRILNFVYASSSVAEYEIPPNEEFSTSTRVSGTQRPSQGVVINKWFINTIRKQNIV